MKAYICGIHSDDDAGNIIVFAKNSKEAIKQARKEEAFDYAESFVDYYVRRAPEFDDMEKLTDKELSKEKWRNGWIWFEHINVPAEEQSEDRDFYEWYEKTFEKERINK